MTTRNADEPEIEINITKPPALVVDLKIGETMVANHIVVIATLENDEQQLLFLDDKGAFILSALLEGKLIDRQTIKSGETN